MIDGMFMNSNSSTESSLEEDKGRLSIDDSIFPNDNHEEQFIHKQQHTRKRSSSRNSLVNNKDLVRSSRESTWRTNSSLEKIG